jgi:hypothetical protein
MVLVGSVDEWLNISFDNLSTTGSVKTSETDKYWLAYSSTIVGPIIGSILAVYLADSGQHKCCRILCSLMLVAGWRAMYITNSMPILYFALVSHGISVGISRTANPMYMLGGVDIDIIAIIGTLSAIFVYLIFYIHNVSNLNIWYDFLAV